MNFTFAVTAYNIEDYIGACLDSLAPCLRPGDQLIVIDDGSSDCSCEEITAALARLEQSGAELCPVFLGANTQGGVGIPANVALAEARGEALFFVDGDDLVNPEELGAARLAFERHPCDLLIANYRVYDEQADRLSQPADWPLWSQVSAAQDLEGRRSLALQMIGVPWRKIYRLEFLRRHAIRFPEGAFFYEDNPFHWQACLNADSIRFLDRSVCLHRMGRAGQTMAARGTELLAFFDHFERILSGLPNAGYRAAALRWLLENMAWHIERLDPAAYWIYASRAGEALCKISEADWLALRHDPVALRTWGMARSLAQGDLAAVVSNWQGQALWRQLQSIEERVNTLTEEAARQGEVLGELQRGTEGQRALQEFRALKMLAEARVSPAGGEPL